MEAWLLTALPISMMVLIALIVGILIGAIGIGGVLLVPSLTGKWRFGYVLDVCQELS